MDAAHRGGVADAKDRAACSVDEGGGSAFYLAGLRWSSAAGTCALGGGEVGVKEGVRREFGECVGGEGKGVGVG